MAGREVVHVASPVGSFGRQAIVSPFQFKVTGEDNLRVTWMSPISGTLTLALRSTADDGSIAVAVHNISLSGDRALTRQLIPLGAGFLNNLCAYLSVGSSIDGAAFIVVELVRGFSGAIVPLGVILQGYVSNVQSIAWPGSTLAGSTEGPGWRRVLQTAVPAAGANIDQEIPGNTEWRLVGVNVAFTASAAAGNRRIYLFADHPVRGNLFRSEAPRVVVAGESVRLFWSAGIPFQAALSDTAIVAPIPLDMRANGLDGPMTIETLVNGIQAGDQFGAATLIVDEWMRTG